MDAGGAAAAAYCLGLKIEGLSQTEWCHHWAGEPHNNPPPMWWLFSDNLIDQNQSADGIHCEGSWQLFCFVSVCLQQPVGVDSSMRPCLHLVIPAPPSCHWQLACLCVSTLNTGRGITPQSSLSPRLSDSCNNNTHYKETRELCKSNEHTWKLMAFLRVQAVELCDSSFSENKHAMWA